MSETHRRSDQHSDPVDIPGFSNWNTERSGSDKGGGGLCIFYRSNLHSHAWTPKVPANLKYVENERQWLLLTTGQARVAFLHIYIACQSHKNDGFLQWNEDLFQLVTTETIKLRRDGFTVISMGDFNTRIGAVPGLEGNTPDINQNTPMFLNFVTQTNMVIVNTLPLAQGIFTRFMDNTGQPGTQALLDYGLIDSEHVHTVSSFVIDADARFQCGSDHALLHVVLEFGSRSSVNWSYQEAIQYNFCETTDFSSFQTNLDNDVKTVSLTDFSNLDSELMLSHITRSLKETGKKCFNLKVKKKKRGLTLPKPLIDKIKLKNDLSLRLAHLHQHPLVCENLHLDPQDVEDDLTSLKAEIKSLVCDLKLKRRCKLRCKILRKDPSRKKFWRFLKSQIKSAGQISAAYQGDKVVFEQAEIEDAILGHFGEIFKGQRHPVFLGDDQPDQVSLCMQDLQKILQPGPSSFLPTQFESQVCSPFTFPELEKTLDALPTAKASGYDGIPHEFLKHSGFGFRHYLLLFLNKIIQDGKVPSVMNIGKCMLVHKVI